MIAALTVSILVAVAGGIIVVVALAGRSDTTGMATRRALRAHATRRLNRAQQVQLAVGGAIGLVAAFLTGWWLLVIAVPLAFIGLPWLLQKGPQEDTIKKLDALESWTRSLSGLTSSGASLERTITASLNSCPEAIKPEVTQLVARLNARYPISVALQAFADDLNDETADVLVMHLLRKAELSGTGLEKALEDLAGSMFARVKVRRQIEADRATPRNEARYVVYFSAALLVALILFQGYSAPYGTPIGQLLLGAYLALYVLVLLWMRRISQGKPNPRALVADKEAEQA